ncbi:hypothetical protein [Kibdelosporangium phytohabitans]|uniref:Uncharacterized protein n=1 Tax=Kibdelosporangium phytohabitans TaxID=860235 RepID=A0A0N9IEB1_9PSEU|nr:hypothetical protein [Kibdelosporangium phytohabitans]ALG13722.1 hypothetical protein AOZ06_48790 [Kibdelosporangium phytohabitans]MBE1465613.1 hypothetical protein [Kibdelosporangium phytohabitans]
MLETQSVYRAPGAVANLDMAAVMREMRPGLRLVIAPSATRDRRYAEEVAKPLENWGKPKGIRVITVTGLAVWDGPSNLTNLRQWTAYMDATGPVLQAIRKTNQQQPGDLEPAAEVGAYPAYPVVEPTGDQVADLAGKLRQNPVYDAQGAAPGFTRSAGVFQQQYGFSARVVVLPALKAGEPFVDYAPALAKQFPDDVVVVAQGYWVEVAGRGQDRLTSARDYAYANSSHDSFAPATTVDRWVATIARRIADMNHRKPFGEPLTESRGLVRRIADHTPPVLGGSAVVLGVSVLLGAASGRRRRRRETEIALRKAKATAYARISELAAALTLIANSDAADRYAEARDLFAKGRTADAERAAGDGLALL